MSQTKKAICAGMSHARTETAEERRFFTHPKLNLEKKDQLF